MKEPTTQSKKENDLRRRLLRREVGFSGDLKNAGSITTTRATGYAWIEREV